MVTRRYDRKAIVGTKYDNVITGTSHNYLLVQLFKAACHVLESERSNSSKACGSGMLRFPALYFSISRRVVLTPHIIETERRMHFRPGLM